VLFFGLFPLTPSLWKRLTSAIFRSFFVPFPPGNFSDDILGYCPIGISQWWRTDLSIGLFWNHWHNSVGTGQNIFKEFCIWSSVAALDLASDLFLCKEKLAYFQQLSIPVPSDEELKVAKFTLLRELATLENNCPNDVLHLQLRPEASISRNIQHGYVGCYSGLLSTALCESTFSALSRIDEPSRRSMSSSRKSNLLLLAF